jgi:hypothetical protein
LSRDLQLNCIISFFFRLHLVLHTYAARFDVTGTIALFEFIFETKQALKFSILIGDGDTASCLGLGSRREKRETNDTRE